MDSFDFSSFILTLKDGTRFAIQREDLGDHWVEDPPGSGAFNYIHSYGKASVQKITTRSLDTITITPSDITHRDSANTLTHTVSFQRDSANRVTAIYDPLSGGLSGVPSVKYHYDSDGNLDQVSQLTDRANQTYLTSTFSYTNVNAPHYITSIKEARGLTRDMSRSCV